MSGHSFVEIKKIMQSPYFNEIAKLCKGFLMSKLHQGVSSKNIIKFMALDGNIPSINAKALKFAIGSFPSSGLNKCFYLKMRYETDDKGRLLTFENGRKVPISDITKREKLIKRTTPLYFFKPDINGELQQTVVDDNYIAKLDATNSETYKSDYKY